MAVQQDARARLDELKQEYQRGDARLQALVRQETSLREMMLRIEGAIQVLEELLLDRDAGTGDGAGREADSTMSVG
ncbi:hypothetical protein [Saccharopolyspora rosea]|nr:hypothetical protein [Saccharopolyspora rosea]